MIDFRLQLIREILQSYHTPKPTIGCSLQGCKPTRLATRHFPSLVPQTTERKLLRKNVLYVRLLIEDRKREQIHVICVKIVMWVFA